MAAENNVAEIVVSSPKKASFRLEFLLPPDQTKKKLRLAMTIHHKNEYSFGNAWVIGPDGKAVQLIPEIKFQGPPREGFLYSVLGDLEISIASNFGKFGPAESLYSSHFRTGIQGLLEERAKEILRSLDLNPLEKARGIYNLIVEDGMEGKYSWIEQIHELVFEEGALSLYEAGLCEARLLHEQEKFGLGRKYLTSWVNPESK